MNQFREPPSQYSSVLIDHIEQYNGSKKEVWLNYCNYVQYTLDYCKITDPDKARFFLSLMGYTFFSKLLEKFPEILTKTDLTFDIVKYMGELLYDKK